MFKNIVFFLIFCSSIVFSQEVVPLIDFNGYFRSFQNGFFRQLEFQRIRNFKFGDNVVGYTDNRGNLRVFDGGKPRDLANVDAEYEVSDNLLTWKIGPTLNVWDQGNLKTLTFNADNYFVKDSIIVFQDTRFNTLNVYYKNEIIPLTLSSGQSIIPDCVGENIIAYRDNGNFYKVFWNGNIYDLDVWHNPIIFEAGTNILAFNDPINGTFALFENGQFLDLENFYVERYKAGNESVVYTDRSGNFMRYHNGKKQKISSFIPTNWDLKDDVLFWVENGISFALIDDVKVELGRYKIDDFIIKNKMIAYRNIQGGVSCVFNGEVKELTLQRDAQFSIHGNAVLVELFNKSFVLFKEGVKTTL